MSRKSIVWTMVVMVAAVILSAAPTGVGGSAGSGSGDGLIPKRVYVHMANRLDPTTAMVVHCKSKDDDLGSHTVAPGAQYGFSFKPNAFGFYTLFFCHFEWTGPDGQTESKYFDIYKQLRDEERCPYDCCWTIQSSGPCDCTGACYPWNKSL